MALAKLIFTTKYFSKIIGLHKKYMLSLKSEKINIIGEYL